MIAVALKGVAGRKVRALLTALAIVIGVTMVSGTLVLTDTIQKGFDGVFGASYQQTDAVIAGKEIVKDSQSGAATVPESLLAKVRALPGVAAAGGTLAPIESNRAEIFGRDGKALGSGGAPQFGLGNDASLPQFSPLKLKTGQWPEGSKQVALDADTAAAQHFKVGNTVTVATLGAKHRYKVTGIATFGGLNSLGGATIAIWDMPTAQALLNKRGRFDGISIAAKDGTSPTELIRAVQPLVPASLEVKSFPAAGGSRRQGHQRHRQGHPLLPAGLRRDRAVRRRIRDLQHPLDHRRPAHARVRHAADARGLAQAGHALGRDRRPRDRAAGLGDRAVRRVRARETADRDRRRPPGGRDGIRAADGPRLARARHRHHGAGERCARPARDAGPADRGSPRGLDAPPSRFAAHSLKTAVIVTAASVVAICIGIFASGLATLAVVLLLVIGILALFLGVAFAAPHMVKPLTRLLGLPARRSGGVAGELANANSVRNPSRTASTAAALMIGLTLVTVVAVLGAGMRHTVESAVTDQVSAAYILNGSDGDPFAAAEGDALARVPGVTAASHVRVDKALVAGKEQDVTGVDPATIARFYRFNWTHGSDGALARLGTDGALVTQTYADDQGLAAGDPLSIQTASGDRLRVAVRGIYDPPEIEPMLGPVSITKQAFDRAFPQPENRFTFLDAGAGTHQALTTAAAGFSDADVHTGAAFAKDYTKGFASFLNFLYVLLAFSVVVSLFGMVNTLVLSVFERTRELGMLRTIGMTRRQARRMIRHESVITALIGAALGLPLGIFLAGLVTQALSKYDIAFSIPIPQLRSRLRSSPSLPVLAAAIMPARRASRLNVLDALHYE